MVLNIIRVAAVLLTAVTMSAGFAHLMEMPAKLQLSRDAYFTVQQIYRGWNRLGVIIFLAFIATVVWAVLVRHDRVRLVLLLTAAGCIVLSLLLFFTFTFPANQRTQNWTIIPDNWEQLRRRWEYSHATGAMIYFLTLLLLTIALLPHRGEE